VIYLQCEEDGVAGAEVGEARLGGVVLGVGVDGLAVGACGKW
jgi:hypothetical protein